MAVLYSNKQAFPIPACMGISVAGFCLTGALPSWGWNSHH